MKLLLLDLPGLISASVLGAMVIVFGGAQAGAFLALMFAFLFSGVMVTKFDYARKRELAVYEHERSWENVMANGIVPALLVAANHANPIFTGAFVGSLAAATADKFASELGVLGGKPYSLMGLKRVRPGTSGAVSLLGLFVSFDGGALVGLAAFFLLPGYSLQDALLLAGVGLAGSLFDSLVGIFEENGIGSKSTTNLACALSGAVLGFLLLKH